MMHLQRCAHSLHRRYSKTEYHHPQNWHSQFPSSSTLPAWHGSAVSVASVMSRTSLIAFAVTGRGFLVYAAF